MTPLNMTTDLPPKLRPEYRLHRRLMRKLGEAIREFSLVSEGDRLLLGLSGGKDSLALLDFLGEMMAHTDRRFSVMALHVRMRGIDYLSDTSYLEAQAARWDIPLRVEQAVMEPDRNARRSPCFLCSWNRRKVLFRVAQEEGFNKIALGHHQDDILRTALMNLTFNGTFSTMPVRLRMTKFPVSIIRPLALMCEDDLREWAALQGYRPVEKICSNDTATNRTNVLRVTDELERLSPDYRRSLWHALLRAGALVQE